MTRAYYKGAVGALIVFDWSNVKTFDAVDKWKRDLVSTEGFLITGYSRVFYAMASGGLHSLIYITVL